MLVRVSSYSLVTNEHITNPHGASTLTLERTLVVDTALGLRRIMVDINLLLNVLSGISEVDTVEDNGRARIRQDCGRVDSNDITAEGDKRVLELCIFANRGKVATQVQGVSVPLLNGDEVQTRTSTEHNFQVFN